MPDPIALGTGRRVWVSTPAPVIKVRQPGVVRGVVLREGPPGKAGAPGPVSVTVGATTTTAPGSPATVTNTGTAEHVELAFSIPGGGLNDPAVATLVGDPGTATGRAISDQITTALAGHPLARLRAALGRRHVTPARVAFYGSSTTAGVAATTPANRYVNLLARRLQAAFPSGIAGYEYPVTTPGTLAITSPNLLPGVQVCNGGVGGAYANSYIDSNAMTNIDWLNPACCVHMIGSNDYHLGVNPATYRSQIESRLDAIDAVVNPVGCHVLVHTYRRGDVTTPAYPWSAYGEQLRAIAATRPNVAFIDLSAEYETIDAAGADPYDVMDWDLVHQTDAGHALMADLIFRALGLAESTPAPAPRLVDTFTRPDGPLGATEAPAQPWQVLSGTWAVTGRKVGLTAGGTVLVETGLADLDVTVVIDKGAGSPTAGLVFRASDDSNRLGFFISPVNGQAQLYRMDAGTNTLIAVQAGGVPDRTQYVLRVVAKGDQIACYVNGTRVINHTLTAGDQAKFGVFTKVGFRCSSAPTDLRWWGLTVRPA